MKLLIIDDDDLLCLEIDDVEKMATVPVAGGGVALSQELRTTLCAYFVDGIVPVKKPKTKNNVVHFPNYQIRELAR